jgi:hypothetical protein
MSTTGSAGSDTVAAAGACAGASVLLRGGKGAGAPISPTVLIGMI